MTVGPVEYLIVGFPENKFDGTMLPALGDLVDSGTVRILDLVFIAKNGDGEIVGFEFEDLPELAEHFEKIEGEAGGLLSDEDIQLAAAGLEPNTSAALLIWEDLWAKEFAAAIRANGAVLLAGSRIPHDIVEAALQVAGS